MIRYLAPALVLLAIPQAHAATVVRLDQLDVRSMRQGWSEPQRDRSVLGRPLTVAGRVFAHGVGTHAASRWIIPAAAYSRFRAWVGVDDEMRGHPGSVEFVVVGDSAALWRSGVMRVGTPARRVDVPLRGVRILELVVTDAGDGIDSDHADWCDATLDRIPGAGLPASTLLTSAGIEPSVVRPKTGSVTADASAAGGAIRIAGHVYPVGLGMRVPADAIYADLTGAYSAFGARVGVDDAAPPGATASFRVLVDGRVAATVGPIARGHAPVPVRVSLRGARDLRLVAIGRAGVPVAFVEPTLALARSVESRAAAATGRTVRASGIAVGVGRDGRIAWIQAGTRRYAAPAETYLAGCAHSRAAIRLATQGGVLVSRVATDVVTGRSARIEERITPAGDSVRWQVDIRGTGAPWSTAVCTRLRWPATSGTRFWTAWADPRGAAATGWIDPLHPVRPADRRLWYGAPAYTDENPRIGYCPFLTDIISLPLATFLEPAAHTGVSLVLSPADRTFDMSIATDASGGITLTRIRNRLERGRTVRFTMDLVAHGADWRPAVAWMARRYPRWFEPAVPAAQAIAGCGAYSTFQSDLDAEKMRRMAFTVNWQASFEFPYMGMFLPPVPPDEPWDSFRHTRTTIAGLEEYYARMRRDRFAVLSYFNVTEFGAHIVYPAPARKADRDAGLWKDPNDFLYGRLATAILPGPDGKPIGTWEGGIAVDPGDATYQAFLEEQWRRHIDRTPSSAGFCIDRMDWLRLYNRTRDDGLCWFEGKRARSVQTSWLQTIARLAPIAHRAGKAIFVNNHTKRLDTLRDIDGIYDEFGYSPASLNATALLGVRRPVIGWTADENSLKPDPNAHFQRQLHMGTFPTAPVPGNDHCINPTPWAERWYLDYGPLLNAMRGRTWVLTESPAQVVGGKALVNVFRVPSGLALPVTFGGQARSATVVLRGDTFGKAAPRCRAILPGREEPAPVRVRRTAEGLRIETPLARGCAMVLVDR